MAFATEQEVLDWYDGQERVLTNEWVAKIPWHEVAKHELNPEFIPVLVYMRDVEKLTDVYVRELRKTPTAKHPVIARFLERWSTEEDLHGELLNRFLGEAGYPSANSDWFAKTQSNIPLLYRLKSPIQTSVTNLIGKQFTAVHMTWGAIQELSTLSGYERLWRRANHPVLEYLLRAIVREEARHALFYWSVAHIRLLNSPLRQHLARFLVEKFWTPVGQGTKREADTNYVIATLFRGAEGLDLMNKRVNERIAQLPGFVGFDTVKNRIAQISA